MVGNRTLHRLLLVGLFSGWLTPLSARAATSIFDDENWEDPKIETATQPPKAPPPPTDNTHLRPAPTEPTPPPTPTDPKPRPKHKPPPVHPPEPAKPALPLPPDLEPRELIRQANE